MLVRWAISILGSALLSCIISAPALSLQSRVEERTDTKAEAKEKSEKKSKPAKRTVWNLDGGVFFATDGHLPNGSCFRLNGQMNATDFFDGLRRVDSEDGT